MFNAILNSATTFKHKKLITKKAFTPNTCNDVNNPSHNYNRFAATNLLLEIDLHDIWFTVRLSIIWHQLA